MASFCPTLSGIGYLIWQWVIAGSTEVASSGNHTFSTIHLHVNALRGCRETFSSWAIICPLSPVVGQVFHAKGRQHSVPGFLSVELLHLHFIVSEEVGDSRIHADDRELGVTLVQLLTEHLLSLSGVGILSSEELRQHVGLCLPFQSEMGNAVER